MQITLEVAGKKRTYVPNFVSGRMFRRTLEVSKELQKGLGENELDAAVDYIVELYGGQFTRDEFYDGIAVQELVSSIRESINSVMNKGKASSDSGDSNPN